MQIENLLPTYFTKEKASGSEVWGKKLSFEKGELIKIVAPSGSGKTSLIHFIYGMRHDYHGTIKFNGKNIRELQPDEFSGLRKNVASIVFQDLRLFPEQTVKENIEIKRKLQPFHPEEEVAEMCNRLGIGDKLDSLVKTCSYGEQQRIAIIRSLMQPFDYLLLDEPFSHLDNRNSEIAMELMLEEAKKRNACILFADLERIDYFPWTRLYHL